MKKLSSIFAAVALSAAMIVPTVAQAAGITNVNVPGRKIYVVNGELPSKTGANTVVFKMDVSSMGMGEYMGNDRIALVPYGANKATARVCPFFNIAGRDYTITRDPASKGDHRVAVINATITQAEYDAVRRAGCVVVTKPGLSEVINIFR